MPTPFVGRSSELADLLEAAGAAIDGPAIALIVGDPGSGKSRLLREAAERISSPHLFSVVGYEPEQQVPLGAAAPFLRALTNVPGLGTSLEELLLNQKGPLQPVRVFEGATRAFQAHETALLLIDDVQWMDEVSYALCHYLIRAAGDAQQRVAVLAATRPGEKGAAFADPLPDDRVKTIELGPLSAAEGVELALALDPSLDSGRAAEVHKRAGGYPFWVEALTGSDVAGEPGRLLTGRLRGAGADVAELLSILAVAGRPTSTVDAGQILGWEHDRVRRTLAELVRRGIAVETAGDIRLTHDLVREAALGDLPEDLRQTIHRRIAEWLEAKAAADAGRLREALEHRRAAGVATLDLALRLARSPQRALLGADGLRVLASVSDDADPGDEKALMLHEEVAALATELAAHEDALARWLLVADRAEEPGRRAAALLAASKAAFALDRVEEAREHLERSREVDETEEVLRLEQATHDAAISLWLEQRTADGRSRAREAVVAAKSLAKRSGDVTSLAPRARRAYIDALRLDYESAMQEGDARALLRAAEAREAVARGFDLELYLAASLAVGSGLRSTGRVYEAADRFRRLWADALRHVLPRLGVDAGFWLAQSLLTAARLTEAEEVVAETTELATRAGDVPRARHRVTRVACAVALERGRPREALRQLEEETAGETNTHQRIQFHQDVAVWSARLDGPSATENVENQLAAGQACAETIGCPRCAGELLLFSAEALARIGKYEESRNALAEWDARGIVGTGEHMIERLHAQALSAGEADSRVGGLEEALAEAEQSSYELARLWIALDLGLALADAKDEGAIAALERAAEAAQERGAATVQGLAEQSLRSLGVRTWRRGVLGAPLTEREAAVVRLIAGGATNPEIAQELFLSRKTVERHVSNALKKMGVRNRAELAAKLVELEGEGVRR